MVSIEFNVYGILSSVTGLVASVLAAAVFFAGSHRAQNRRLALVILLLGQVSIWAGVRYLVDDPSLAVATAAPFLVAYWTLGPAMLRFVATLPSPLAGPLRRRSVDSVLQVAMAIPTLLWAPIRDWSVHGVLREDRVAWRVDYGEGWIVLQWIALGVQAFAALVAATAWIRSPKGSLVRRQLAFYAAASLYFDGLGSALRVVIFLGDRAPSWTEHLLLASVPVIIGGFVLLLAYGILRAHLFDIDLRIKLAISRSAVMSAFIAAFLVATVMAENFLTGHFGWIWGGLAAGVLLIILRPLQRFGDRVADVAMPGVTNTPAYVAYRKLEVYRAALEGVGEDRRITARERRILERLRSKLGIAHADAALVEREALGGRPVEAA